MSTASTSTLTGSDNEQKAFNYFVAKGLGTTQAAGIIGNFMQESGVNPSAIQSNNVGHGIAQWSAGERWDTTPNDNVKDFANGRPMTDLGVQLDFVWYELAGPYANALTQLKTTTNITDATTSFELSYEKSADKPGSQQWQNRINFAEQTWNLYHDSAIGPGGSACAVRCNQSQSTTAISLSPVRRSVVCLAQQELAAWTPLPAIPRLEFVKYADGSVNDQWCADFVSWIYRQANYPFTGGYGTGGWRLPAVTEIMQLGQQEGRFHWHPSAGYTPIPGDIAIHKNDATGYSHTNLVVSVVGNHIILIGGDQGSGPYGGPDSASVVSLVSYNGSTGDSTIGYVSPE